jgi:hypothetical protein
MRVGVEGESLVERGTLRAWLIVAERKADAARSAAVEVERIRAVVRLTEQR